MKMETTYTCPVCGAECEEAIYLCPLCGEECPYPELGICFNCKEHVKFEIKNGEGDE